MKTTHTQARQCQIQLLAVLVAGIGLLAAAGLWRWDLARAIYLSDAKNIVLNGAIVVVFAAGIWQLIQAFGHYDFEEKQVAEFLSTLARRDDIDAALAAIAPRAIIAGRCEQIKDLFDRRVPIHHGALAAIMVAEQGTRITFARFVNNVLILTGVFGTIVSLVFALAGAGRTLGSAVPTEGMALMLSGMNTALTTTVTAITCFFVFSYFYGKLTDVQTHVFGRIENAVLVHVIPRFAFDAEAINHQTAQLIRQLEAMVVEVRHSTGSIAQTLAAVTAHNARSLEKLEALIAGHNEQVAGTGKVIQGLERLHETLVEGFRLNPKR